MQQIPWLSLTILTQVHAVLDLLDIKDVKIAVNFLKQLYNCGKMISEESKNWDPTQMTLTEYLEESVNDLTSLSTKGHSGHSRRAAPPHQPSLNTTSEIADPDEETNDGINGVFDHEELWSVVSAAFEILLVDDAVLLILCLVTLGLIQF